MGMTRRSDNARQSKRGRAPVALALGLSLGAMGAAIAVLDADSVAVKAVIPVGKRVWGLALSRDGSRLYSANGLDNTVSVIDTEKNAEINTIAVGERPWGVALDD